MSLPRPRVPPHVNQLGGGLSKAAATARAPLLQQVGCKRGEPPGSQQACNNTPDWSCQIPYSGLGASIMIIMTRAVAL